MSVFPYRLKELRVAAGMTQKELAEKIGAGLRTITRFEAGEREPDWSTVLALATALGVDCRAFTETPTNPPHTSKPGRPRRKRP